RARETAGRDARLSSRWPLLRDRPAVSVCLGEVRDFPKGGALVQAICDFVHQEVTFGYEHASVARTAFDTFKERRGVCRDFAHLASRSAAATSIDCRRPPWNSQTGRPRDGEGKGE